MTCKGICSRYKAQKPVGTGRYASGQRRCQICEIFIKWEGLWCPCCGYRLRTKPRNLKYKAKLRARVEAEAQEATGIKSTFDAAEEIMETKEPIVAKAKTARKAKTTKKAKASIGVQSDTQEPTVKPKTRKSKAAIQVETDPQEAIAIKA